MITEEQIKEFDESLEIGSFGRAENIRECLEEYEQSKWIKFDPQDESTWPKTFSWHIAFDGNKVTHRYWSNHMDMNQNWFVSERANNQKTICWQPLPQWKNND